LAAAQAHTCDIQIQIEPPRRKDARALKIKLLPTHQ
jgi:hypothetical protein